MLAAENLQTSRFSAIKMQAERVLVTPRPALTASGRNPLMAQARVCSEEGCGKPASARGWCASHYALWRRNGKPNRVRQIGCKKCSVDCCDKASNHRLGYCSTHAWRYRTHGDIHRSRPAPLPPRPCLAEGCANDRA